MVSIFFTEKMHNEITIEYTTKYISKVTLSWLLGRGDLDRGDFRVFEVEENANQDSIVYFLFYLFLKKIIQ